MRLAPGDGLVAGTDGVLEAGAPNRVLSPEQLAERRPSGGELDADGLATALEEIVGAEGRELRDDYR